MNPCFECVTEIGYPIGLKTLGLSLKIYPVESAIGAIGTQKRSLIGLMNTDQRDEDNRHQISKSILARAAPALQAKLTAPKPGAADRLLSKFILHV